MPHLTQCFAGWVAECKANPAAGESAAYHVDELKAFMIADGVITALDVTRNPAEPDPLAEPEQKNAYIKALFTSATTEAARLLHVHWQAVLIVAELLMVKQRLTGNEVAAIVNAVRADTSTSIMPRPLLTP
jgi:hypothetical protein